MTQHINSKDWSYVAFAFALMSSASVLAQTKPTVPTNPATSAASAATGVAKPCPAGSTKEVCNAYETGFCSPSLTDALCAAKIAALPIGNDWPSMVATWLKSSGVLESILGLLSAVLLFVITKLRKRISLFTIRLGDPLIPNGEKRPFRTRGLNLLVIGEGGTGKTSLIRALSGSPHAAPSRSTAMPRTYCLVHEVDIETPRANAEQERMLERIYVNDYQGQRSEQLVKESDLPRREKHIRSTVLLLVVDLFPPSAAEAPRRQAAATFDSKRVESQISAYPENTLQMLFGLSTELKQVILFINKIDLIRPFVPGSDSMIREAYRPLIKRIGDVGRQFEFKVVLGAAARGDGVAGFDPADLERSTLYEILKSRMVPIVDPQTIGR